MMTKSWAASALHDVNQLHEILLALENSAPVALIATFDLETCRLDDSLQDVLNQPDLKQFDYIPVVDSDSIVGVLSRHEVSQLDGTIQENMRLLHESILISADASLLSFVEVVDQYPVRLVLRGRKITGIVTISDLQKLAVRPLLFMLVTSVELLLAEWLRQNCTDDEQWFARLSVGRQAKVEKKWNELSDANLAIDYLTATDFCDKRVAFLKLATFEPGTKGATEEKLEEIEKLRDSVAHASDYAHSHEKAKKVAQTVRWAWEFIRNLQIRLESLPASELLNVD